MPIFNVRAPDGSIMKINGPEDATDAELIDIAQQNYKPEPTFGQRLKSAWKEGLEQIPESIEGIKLGAEAGLGFKGAAEKKLGEIKSAQQAPSTGIQGLTFQDLEDTYGKEGAIAALKKLPAYVGEQIASNAPSMAAPLAAGEAATMFGGPIAGVAAGIGTYGLQQYGQFMQRQAQGAQNVEQLEPGKAALAAAATAPLGYFVDRLTAGLSEVPVSVIGENIFSELAKRAGSTVAGRAASGATLGVIAESPTEVLEQMAERWQAGLPLFDDKAKQEYKEAAAGAAVVGGIAGGAGHVLGGQHEELAPESYTKANQPSGAPLATLPQTTSSGFDAQQAADLRAEADRAEAQRIEAENASALEKQNAAQESAREMPGFAGAPNINADLIAERRAQNQQEMEQKIKDQKDQIDKIKKTRFSDDEFQNQLRKDIALRQAGATEETAPVQVNKTQEDKLVQTLPEPPQFVQATPTKFKTSMPVNAEDQADVKDARQQLKDVNKQIKDAKASSTDLFRALSGKMHPEDVSELVPKLGKSAGRMNMLVNKKGTAKRLSSMVADGELNDYLPDRMKITEPGQDESAGVQYILDKLRSGDTRTLKEKNDLEVLERQKDELLQRIEAPEKRAYANAQAQIAAQAGENEEPSTEDLINDAKARGIDAEGIMHDVAVRMPDATQEQYLGEVRNQLNNANAAIEGRKLNEPQFMRRDATQDQIDIGEQHAKDFGGRIPYQNGDIGLIQAFNRLGDHIFLPFDERTRYRKDVDALKESEHHFTKAQIDELRMAKKKILDVENSRKNKLVHFNKDGVGFSPDIDKRIAGVVADWKKMLGIDKNVYVTTMEFSRRNAFDYTGPYKRIGAAALDERNNGLVQGLENGEYYIAFKKTSSPMRMLETLAHELGHIHEAESFNNASPEMKKALQEEHAKWVASQKGKSAKELIESLRAKRAGRQAGNIVDKKIMASELNPYWTSFSEWYADQVARWATTQEKPLTSVQKFFHRIGQALLNFYKALRGQKYLPTETFKKYIDQVSVNVPNTIHESSAGQMPLFMREAATANEAQKGRDAMEMLSSINREPVPEPSFIEKSKAAINSIPSYKTNKAEAKEYYSGKARRFDAAFVNKMFSSSHALTSELDRMVQRMSVSDKEKIGMMLEYDTSQASNANSVANAALWSGGAKYDDNLKKWVSFDDERNIQNLSKEFGAMMKRYGLSVEEAGAILHTSFEARRTQELNQRNADIDAQIKQTTNAADIAKLEKKKKNTQNMSPDEIHVGLKLYENFPELKKINEIWNGMRENGINTMVEGGLYSREEAEVLMDSAAYVPFYREDQIEQGKGPKELVRSLKVAADKRMKGSEKPVNNILDNMIRWNQYAISRSVRAKSGRELALAAAKHNLGHEVFDATGPNVVTIWDGGRERHFYMEDPLFVDAFTGLESVALPLVDIAGKMTNLLRKSVVLYPVFSVAQIPQDSFAAMFTSGLKPRYALKIPMLAVKEFIQTLRGKSEYHEQLKRAGVTGLFDHTAEAIRDQVESSLHLKGNVGFMSKIKNALGHWAMASDNAVRQAVYQASMEQGLSKAEALQKSIEIFNPYRRGTSKELALASRMIPFFNAYIAVQHVAYRTLTGKSTSPTSRAEALKTLSATAGSVFIMSLLYAMMNGDDEDYIRKPTPTRDRLLMIPGSGGVSIPIRSDVFSLPKILAEHLYLLMTDNGFEDGPKFRASMSDALVNSILSPTVVPQAIKPLVEWKMNYDFFQGKPIVNAQQSKEDISRQFDSGTSEFAKLLGSAGVISPMVADHLIKGFFGTTGGLGLYVTNPMIAAATGKPRPEMSFSDAVATVPGMSGFLEKSNESALRHDFYQLREVTSKAAQTMSDIQTRNPEDLADYLSNPDNVTRIGLNKQVNSIASELTKIRTSIEKISTMPETQMGAEEKGRRIEELRKTEEKILKGVDVKRLRELANM